MAKELKAEPSQIKGLFKRIIKTFNKTFYEINQDSFKGEIETKINNFVEKEDKLREEREAMKNGTAESALESPSETVKSKPKSKEQQKLIENLEKEYSIKGNDQEWEEATKNLKNGKAETVLVKSAISKDENDEESKKSSKKNKRKHEASGQKNETKNNKKFNKNKKKRTLD